MNRNLAKKKKDTLRYLKCFSKRMTNDNNMIFLYNNQVSLNFPPYKCHEKKKIFFKKYENFSQKADFKCLTNLERQ